MSASKVKRLTREIIIEDYFVAEVERCGGLAPKLVDQGRRGFPDRTVIWPRRVHFVELKKPVGGIVASWQERYHDDLRERGASVFVIYSKADVDCYISNYAPISS
jgi:hypothetical protein